MTTREYIDTLTYLDGIADRYRSALRRHKSARGTAMSQYDRELRKKLADVQRLQSALAEEIRLRMEAELARIDTGR